MNVNCCAPPEDEPLLASSTLMPPTSQEMPSAVCTVHGVFWLTVIYGITMAIADGVLLQTYWVLPLALLSPLLFTFVFLIIVLVGAQKCGCYSLSSNLQISLMQHPDYIFSRLTMPFINVVHGMQLCDNAFCQKMRAALGKNYVYAGMVSFGEYEAVAQTLKSQQHRTSYLGAQPLANLPKVDRDIFFLMKSNTAVHQEHDKFVACFRHYMFREGFTERIKSEKSQRFWNQLAEDYKSMPHGVGELFYSSGDRGLRGFFIRYFFYAMLGVDTEDPEIMKDLTAMMKGDAMILLSYLWPFAVPNFAGSTIAKVDKRILASPVLANFVEGEEKYAKMTKEELGRLTTCIMRLAAITGTMQLATTITGGLPMPAFENMEKINLLEHWDKLDLSDEQSLWNYITEVGRLFPPVSSVHHVATEAFSANLQGKIVDFPAGTKILVPTNLAMTDQDAWGVDAFKFQPSRPQLREKSMVFANVGASPAATRVCPGYHFAMDVLMEILRVLGKVRREGG